MGVAEVPQAAGEGVGGGQGIYTFIPYANGSTDPLLGPGSFTFPGTMLGVLSQHLTAGTPVTQIP